MNLVEVMTHRLRTAAIQDQVSQNFSRDLRNGI